MAGTEHIKSRRLQKLDWILIAGIVNLLFFTALPHLPAFAFRQPPIADLFNRVSNEHVGLLMRIEPNRRFPDGTVREGWLVRGLDGMEIWFPADKMKNVERVKR